MQHTRPANHPEIYELLPSLILYGLSNLAQNSLEAKQREYIGAEPQAFENTPLKRPPKPSRWMAFIPQ